MQAIRGPECSHALRRINFRVGQRACSRLRSASKLADLLFISGAAKQAPSAASNKSSPLGRLPNPHSAIRIPQWAAAAAALLLAYLPAALAAAEPYRNLRDTNLEYHGPAEDFTNLTELRLGWFGPSDPADPLAGDVWFAANLAIEEANVASGTGLQTRDLPGSSPSSGSGFKLDSSTPPLPFRLVPRWAGDPWGAGVSQLTRMVYDEQPLALLSSVDSASTHLAEQVVAKAQLPLVSPFTTDKSLTLAGVSWMFAFAPSDAAIARTLVDAILATDSPSSAVRPQSSVLLLSSTDHESRLTSHEVMREFSRRSRLPDSRFELTPNLAIPPQVLEAFDQAAPSIIVIVASAEDSARWLTTLRQRLAAHPPGGTAAPFFFGSHIMGRTRFLELAGPAAEGVRFPLLWTGDTADPQTAAFIERFRAARGHAPDYTAAFTYDATRLLVAAIRRAGPNRARIREALLALSPSTGLSGIVEFDGTGQNTSTAIPMGTIRNGAIVPFTPPTYSPQPDDQPAAP